MSNTRKVLQWWQGPAFLPNPDQWPENRDVSNVVVINESFKLATAHTTATIVRASPRDGFAHLISSAHSLYTLSKQFAYLQRFVQSLESASLWGGNWTGRHSTVVTPFTWRPVQATELYAAVFWAAKVMQRKVFGDIINVLCQRLEQFALAARSTPNKAIRSELLSVAILRPFVPQDGLLLVGGWLCHVHLV